MIHDTLPPGLPPALAGLRAPCYLHHPPAWKYRALLTLALAMVVAGLGYLVWSAARGEAGTGELLLAAFLLLFFVVLVRPSVWRPPNSLAADARGLFFLGSDTSAAPVFVPWSEVGPTSIERASKGTTVVLTIADDSSFWDAARRSPFRRLLLGGLDAEGRRRVSIGNQWAAPEATQAALEHLRGAGHS